MLKKHIKVILMELNLEEQYMLIQTAILLLQINDCEKSMNKAKLRKNNSV